MPASPKTVTRTTCDTLLLLQVEGFDVDFAMSSFIVTGDVKVAPFGGLVENCVLEFIMPLIVVDDDLTLLV